MGDVKRSEFVVDCRAGIPAEATGAVVAAVGGGRLVVTPTDTVYGIGADATDAGAAARVLSAKGRGRQKPSPVLVDSPQAIDELCAQVSPAARRLAEAFWPGALTLVLPARPDLGWDLGDTGPTVALRMPDNDVCLSLIALTGPLAVSSANLTGRPPARTVEEAVDYFHRTVDVYLDGGPARGGVPSTIVDLAHGEPRALRVGALPLDRLARTAGAPIAPGGLAGRARP